MFKRILLRFPRKTVNSADPIHIFILHQDDTSIGCAKLDGRLRERIQHSLQVECGAADDLEYIGGGSLLLQRLPQLIKQPRILDGDDRLLRKIREELDLLVRKRTRLLTKNSNDSDQLIFVQHRHAERAAVSS